MARQIVAVQIDARELQRQMNLLNALPEQVKQASRGAVAKTQKGTQGVIIRGLAREHGVPQKLIRGFRAASAIVSDFNVTGIFNQKGSRGRVRMSKVKWDGVAASARLWVGTYDIPVRDMGTPRQTKQGVRVGSRSFPGAFIATMPDSGHRNVFRRDGPKRRMSKGRYVGKRRQPIKKVSIPMNASDKVLREGERYAAARLQKSFLQELNYRVNVRGK